MDMPTTCPTCLDVVEFEDMIDIALGGAAEFVCEDCAEDYRADE